MRFEWDPDKDSRNRRKHGIGFEEAVRVFDDDVQVLELFDDRHTDQEDRFITIGPIPSGIVLVVWTESVEETVRLISARWATPAERRLYVRRMERYQ